jgi:hypothetical protein
MVVAMRRGPHDPELSPFLAYRNHMHPALHRVLTLAGVDVAQWFKSVAKSRPHTRHIVYEPPSLGPQQLRRPEAPS